MVKKIAIAFLLIALLALGALYIYRYTIIRYYAEKIIRENLPGYVKIDKINFDFINNKISLSNFGILNGPEFSSDFLIKIKEISCRYSILGRVIPTGLEISGVLLNGADIRIERLYDGRVNAVGMENFIQTFPANKAKVQIPPVRRSLARHFAKQNGVVDEGGNTEKGLPAEALAKAGAPSPNAPAAAQTLKEAAGLMNKNLSDIIKLPGSFDIRASRVVFIDRVPYKDAYITTVQSIDGQISIGWAQNYSAITVLSFTLEGILNGYNNERIQWVGSLDPTKPKLTMSNRFEVSNLNLLTFEPYYDRFSPFIFKKGRFSGTLIFDFSDGYIGSTNEMHLSNLAFFVKPGYENSEMWDTTVPDILNYFTTPTGDVVFDFKLKGEMANPTFYLGPISKRAMTSMVINKVASYAIEQVTKQKDGAAGGIDKAKEAIDMFRGLLKKK